MDASIPVGVALLVIATALTFAIREYRQISRRERLRGKAEDSMRAKVVMILITALVAGVVAAAFKIAVDSVASSKTTERPDTTRSVALGDTGLLVASTPGELASPPAAVSLLETPVCPPSDPTDRALPAVEVCVVYWCHGTVYDLDGKLLLDQVQLKIRPRIINNSSDSLTIEIGRRSALRLLVTGKEIDRRWAPPSRTREVGDRPVLIDWRGKKYWGVAPNQPQDAAPTPSGFYTGFATVWDGVILGPGQTYFRPRRRRNGRIVREGDIVFQVPLDSDGDAHIAGLAIVKFDANGRPTVVAIAPRDKWPSPVHPSEF